VVLVSGTQLDQANADVLPDQELFQLFDLMHRGPFLDSVDGVYTFTGFMLIPNQRCRIYVRMTTTRTSYGLDIPLFRHGGGAISGITASFTQELAMKLHADGELYDPVVDRADDYCERVYDLSNWINPRRPVP
jgi:hypothetical protein